MKSHWTPVIGMVCLLPAISTLEAQEARVASGRLHAIGRSSVEVAPDYASVQIGVSTQAPTPTETIDQNSAAAKRVIDFARGFGVAATDIYTGAVNLHANSKAVRDANGQMRQQTDGYQASNSVRVRLRDIGRLGEFMRRAIGEGANQITDVSFGLSDSTKVADDTRTAAVEDAIRKALRLADAAKVKLGRVDEISFPPRTEIRSPGFEAKADLPVRRLAGSMTVPIEAGTIEISAEVDMTWVIEQP